MDPDSSRFVQYTALSAAELNEIAGECGGVGEISAHVYDMEGRPCAPQYAERVIGLTLPEIQQIPFRMGVAAGSAKALPLYGALRGGYLHALITDEMAARGVLEIFERDFRKST
jgi:DNA-binding transcriptional regulator LsrR (DeoR family)